jgi:hypothetical protein
VQLRVICTTSRLQTGLPLHGKKWQGNSRLISLRRHRENLTYADAAASRHYSKV